MAKKFRTPGVYIEEKDSFPGSVVAVETAVPAFIGYTEKASREGKSVLNQPVRITSLAEFIAYFGSGFKSKFQLDNQKPNNDKPSITINGVDKVINYVKNNKAFMFPGLKLFYANGGGPCYIVSVGTYGDKNRIYLNKGELKDGLDTLLKEQEPTMIVIPDAVNLPDNDCYELYRDVLGHCAKIQSRIAILDIQDGYKNRIQDGGQEDIITRFREAIGSENLSYAAVYYPWLETNITDKKDVCFDCLAMDKNEFEALLRETTAQEFFEAIIKTPVSETEEPSDIHEIADDQENQVRTAEEQIPFVDLNGFEITAEHYHLGLLATSPTYSKLIDELWSTINLLPPSSAMAGIYTAVDNDRGVWKSPANISVANVIKPTVNITHDEQENLNVDAVSGKSINAIRTFPGVGTMVWGGRTLDGNSLDWRYINVRRTMIMLEQSIKLALRAYVFEPNDANTWVTVKSMIVNFLTQKWNQGALAGATPEDAFGVQVGLGTTMTSSDILEGRMLIVVNLAIVRPAEFIVVSFEQEMQKS